MKKKTITVLSLFDGISVAQQALKDLGYNIEYYASEIDKYAIAITNKNHPDTIHLGDVTSVGKRTNLSTVNALEYIDMPDIDLLIGGSPCQDLSIAKAKRQGLRGERSGLFYEYLRILHEIKPKYFVLENVASMPNIDRDAITKELGVAPIMIDAALVSAQSRKRYFWTNIPNVLQPVDRGIYLRDVVDTDVNEALQYRRTYWRKNKTGKSPTLTANMGTGGNNVPYLRLKSKTVRVGGAGSPPKSKQNWDAIEIDGHFYRPYNVTELERLQSLPENYTDCVSKTQRKKAIGNAFNKEVIKHILANIKP